MTGPNTSAALAAMDAYLSHITRAGLENIALADLEKKLTRFAEDLVDAAEADGTELDEVTFDELLSHIATVQDKQQEPDQCPTH